MATEGADPATGGSKPIKVQTANVRRVLSGAFVLCCVAAVWWVIRDERNQVQNAVSQFTLSRLSISFALGLVAMAAMLLSWTHVVRALGVPISLSMARGIFPVAQLGKYLPGGVWPLMAQAALGKQAGLSAAVIASAGAVSLALSVGVALLVSGLLVLGPHSQHFATLSAIAALMGTVVVGALCPPVTRRLRRLAALTKFAPRLLRVIPSSGREIARAIAWCTFAQVICGVHLLVLVPGIRFDPASAAYAAAAYSLAAVAGVLVLVAPAGAGVREGTLVLLLQPVATPTEALVIAITSRLMLTLADLVLAALQIRRLREILATTPPPTPGAGD